MKVILSRYMRYPRAIIGALLISLASTGVQSADNASASLPGQLRLTLDTSPHSILIEEASAEVKDHEVGLGALRKIEGSWHYKRSERLSGQLDSSSWQIVDGFSSDEFLQKLVASITADESTKLLFACDGRACGSGSQWASRVFGQRVLYGREDLQRYRVFLVLQENLEYRVILYASARTADRQYLRFDTLEVEGDPSSQ
jgi:Domain of unknown function (DUF4892)